MNSDNPMTTWQREALAGFREQQEAYLESMAAWRNAFPADATVGAAPTPPVPPAGPGLGPNEMVDANRAFMEGLIKQQKDFLEKLTRLLAANG
jgi:hypothetical protein